MQHAHHVVEVVAIDGQARVAPARDLRDQVVECRLRRDRDELGARNHHLARGQVREAEHAVEHLLFLLLEDARLLAGGHQHLQLFFRVHHRAAVGAAEAEHLDHPLRGAVHQPDERREHAHEDLERAHQPHRGGLRPFERDPFRRQLAEDDLERGDDEERQRDGDAVRGGHREVRREKIECRLDQRRERRLGHPPEAQARHRDAELRGRRI